MKISQLKCILVLVGLLMATMSIADQHSDESRLLKKWGFQFNAKGLLMFNLAPQEARKYRPWNPDLSNYLAFTPEVNSPKTLDPLIISSKNKNTP